MLIISVTFYSFVGVWGRCSSLMEAKYGVVCCLPPGRSAMSMVVIGVSDFKLKPR